jgi:hypothetical protein
VNPFSRLFRRPPPPPPADHLAAAARQAHADAATRARSRAAMLALWPQRPGSRPLPAAPEPGDGPFAGPGAP